jgi:uncharacterized Ntn-hydrolase superfamily protein
VRWATPWLAAALGPALLPATAWATWSIAAVDPQTQEVGVAVASCVPAPYGSTILPFVAGLAPGQGALAAQALYDAQLRDDALALLAGGAAPQDVIDMVVAGDPQAATRQYGVVALDLQTAAFTGAATEDWAGHLQGEGVTVQGNILYGPDVVGDALAGFEAEAPRCPWTLADRLMLALEAGAAQGGDNRCSERQSALAAALRVAAPGDDPDAPTLDLRIPSQAEGGDNPVALLRVAYDAWRLDHPPDASGCAEGTSTGADETGPSATSTAPPSSEGLDDPSGPSTGATPLPPASSDGPTDPSATTDAAAAPSTTSGCGCRPTPGPVGALAWLLVAAARPRNRRPPAQ